jgi:hypothetical protein
MPRANRLMERLLSALCIIATMNPVRGSLPCQGLGNSFRLAEFTFERERGGQKFMEDWRHALFIYAVARFR